MAADPSQTVHERLLPHIHLVSSFRYPAIARVDIQEVTKWLLSAPKIARDSASFYWTYLEAPQDGQILLTWQPLQRLGTEFATDGYIWAAGETYYQQEVGNGLILEMFYQRAGYRPGEQFAAHSRRRFRLMPPKVPSPNTPQVDPSLWIVHYGPTDNNERIPVNVIPVDPRTNAMVQSRMQLLRGGQIVRKDFMLADRGNWPQIPLPREGRGQAMYAAPVNARGVPQQMAYPPHQPGAQPHPSKRARTAAAQGPQPHMVGQAAPPGNVFDDEEDTSMGDMFDHLTPREVSIARYQQNHEWMEELLSSPYRIGQIAYPDLGLGLQGELASLTEGIFEAPGFDAKDRLPKKPYIGRLDAGLADEFRKRAEEKVSSTEKEIEQMKARHAKTVAKFKANSIVKHAEQDLRAAVQETGPEIWRLEGWTDDSEEGSPRLGPRQPKNVEDVVASVESALGRHAQVVHDVLRIQDGGYQEVVPVEPLVIPPPVPAPQDEGAGAPGPGPGPGPTDDMSRQHSQSGMSQTGMSQHSGAMVGDSDIDMGGTAAGMLDQMHTGGLSATSTPNLNNFPTPQMPTPQPPSAAGTPAPHEPEVPKDAAADGDWVVVPKDGVSPGPGAEPAQAGAAPPQQQQQQQQQSGGGDEATKAAAPTPGAAAAGTPSAGAAAGAAPASKPASAAPTPADSMALDANDFGSLAGDLDTAGEALAGYSPGGNLGGGTPTNLGDGLDLDMDQWQ